MHAQLKILFVFSTAECAAPVPPTNGMVQSSGVSVGDAAAYSCDQGSELIGTVLAICTQIDSDSAVFAPSAPLCARKFEGWGYCGYNTRWVSRG